MYPVQTKMKVHEFNESKSHCMIKKDIEKKLTHKWFGYRARSASNIKRSTAVTVSVTRSAKVAFVPYSGWPTELAS